MLTAVRSGRFVAWGNALLAGLTSPDEAAEHVAADEQHRLAGLPDVPQSMSQPVSLPVAFARLRALGATALRLALPAPGDPLGLPGPVPFNEAATAAGEAVLVGHGLPLGLVPEVVTHGPPGGSRHRVDTLVAVDWAVHRVNPAVVDVPSLAEAERELAESIRRAAAALSALDGRSGGRRRRLRWRGYAPTRARPASPRGTRHERAGFSPRRSGSPRSCPWPRRATGLRRARP